MCHVKSQYDKLRLPLPQAWKKSVKVGEEFFFLDSPKTSVLH